MTKTYLHWSREREPYRCPICNDTTVLLIVPNIWHDVDFSDQEYEIAEEITGHYCQTCRRLISLTINQEEK